MLPLQGIRIVNLAVNLPGPTAARRLTEHGAAVTKVEPPTGDPMNLANQNYYTYLTRDQEVVKLNIKETAELEKLYGLLAKADLFLTSHRTAALERLGLGWDTLHAKFPHLCQVAIVGEAAPRDNIPGHDLTYQAIEGLLSPPAMPKALIADLGGAERAFSAALALLLHRERNGESNYVQVALADAAKSFTPPLAHGFTKEGGTLGGGLPGYAVYETNDGWLAIASLEPHFWQRTQDALNLPNATHDQLAKVFSAKSGAEWEAFAEEHDLPIAALREPAPPQS